MKHTEKLDTLLFGLYARYLTGDENGTVEEVVKSLNIPLETPEEIRLLTNRLSEDGYINTGRPNKQAIFANITSRGIQYCQEESYSYKTKPIIIADSSPVMQALNELNNAMRAFAEGNEEQLDELIELVKSQRRPRYSLIRDIATTASAIPGLVEVSRKLMTELDKL